MKAILHARELRVMTTTDPVQTLVAPISFTVHAAQPLTLLGETGSGKSLLAQALMGNLPAGLRADGEVEVEGIDLLRLDPRERRRWWGRKLTLLPQEPWHALDPIMPIGRQIEEGHRLVAGLDDHAADQATRDDLARLDLEGTGERLPQQLSGGMAQRAAFAAARTGNAPIVIADEPTKGLDRARRDDVVALLKQALGEHGALLTITHDIAVARQLGGEIMVMKQGECVERGSAETVIGAPQHEFTRRIIAADPERWPARTPVERPTRAPVIEASGLTKRRGGRTLFSDLSLALAPGEVVGVNGPSGCGKSTLGDLLLGLIAPDAGEVRRRGGHAAHRYQKLYQDPPAAFAPHWTLDTLILDLCRRQRLDSQTVVPLMQRLGLREALLERRPGEISGGELQRFAILRALLLEPVFLFADEPTSRLDPITQQETLALLTELARERDCALLLVSHDRALVDHVCDRQLELVAPRPLPQAAAV